jgi:allantoinase
MAKWLCEKPAKFIGLQTKKGSIAKGFDADLVVWDAEKTFRVTEEIIQHKHKVTPYLQQELSGVIEQTFLAGKKVFDGGAITALNQGKIITK